MKLILTCPICRTADWNKTTVPKTSATIYSCAKCGNTYHTHAMIVAEMPDKKPVKRAKPIAKTIHRLMDISIAVEYQCNTKINSYPNLSAEERRTRFRNRLQTAVALVNAEFTPTDLNQKVKDALEDANYHDMVMVIDIIHQRADLDDLVQKYGATW